MLRDKYKLPEEDANGLADFLNSLLEVFTIIQKFSFHLFLFFIIVKPHWFMC